MNLCEACGLNSIVLVLCMIKGRSFKSNGQSLESNGIVLIAPYPPPLPPPFQLIFYITKVLYNKRRPTFKQLKVDYITEKSEVFSG